MDALFFWPLAGFFGGIIFASIVEWRLHRFVMHKLFNVVLPLADLCLGTLMLRSRVSFARARGPAVPDVQPRMRSAAA